MEKPGITINVYGGKNLIAPTASSAVQYFYGDREEKAAEEPEGSDNEEYTEEVTEDEYRLAAYMDDVKALKTYETMLGGCGTARELAGVVGKMMTDDRCVRVDKHMVVKAAFIKALLPFAGHLVSGATVDNIRAQINNMLAEKRC